MATHIGSTTSNGKQPSKKLRREVRDSFDADALSLICTTWDFGPWGLTKQVLEPAHAGRERFLWYKDNGADVLAVAHLDSVQDDGIAQIVNTAAGLMVTSGTLDDRLGAYVILDLLPKLGVNFDILLTTDEEMCQSTAEDFETEKDYNWMFSFDRGGTDVVMYDYDTKSLRDLVEASGARTGRGSFSDICVLKHLGCAGMNWGVGYEDYHSRRAHAWLDDTFRMVARFVKFYRKNHDLAIPYEPKKYSSYSGTYKYSGSSSSGGTGWKPGQGSWWDDDDIAVAVAATSTLPKATDDELAAIAAALADEADKPGTAIVKFEGEPEFDPNSWLKADCGCYVDIDDTSTYVDAGIEFLCTDHAANSGLPISII